MYNPAAELHAVFTEWSSSLASSQRSAAASRSGRLSLTGFDLELHLQATRHFQAVVAALDEFEVQNFSVETYRKYLHGWGRMVFNFPNPWTGANLDADESFPPASMDMLQVLSSVITMRQPRLRTSTIDELASFVQSVLELIASDETVTPELRAYLNRLTREMQAALEDEHLLAGFDLEDAMERLWVGLHAAAGQSTDEAAKGRWRDTAGQIFISAAGSALGSAPTILLGALGM